MQLPRVPEPQGAYVAVVLTGDWAFTSGQLPIVEGELLWRGIVGRDLTVEDAYQAARQCCFNALAVLESALGGLDRIKRIVKVTGFVASASDFTQQPRVINGASDLLLQVFGDTGSHARSVVGVLVLPLNAPVELELLVEVDSE